MRRTRCVFLIAWLGLSLGRGAHADEGAAVAAPGDVTWEVYHDAFRALAQGKLEDARRLLAVIVLSQPTHPAAALAKALLKQVGGPAPEPTETAPPDEVFHEKPTSLARAELASWQTLHGIAVGGDVCRILGCDDAALVALLSTAGGVAGIALSLSLTEGGITPGKKSLLNWGPTWGAWNGAVLLYYRGVEDQRTIGLALLGTQAAGMGLGATLWPTIKPTDGQVSLATSGGIWAGVLTALAFGAGDFDVESENILLSTLLASDAGLLGGAYLARDWRMSRGRALLIDSGGIAGALGSMGIVVLVQGNAVDRVQLYRSMIPGTVVGLAAGAYLTRDWDLPDVPGHLAILPGADGGARAVWSGEL
jgi:hypothetical protein